MSLHLLKHVALKPFSQMGYCFKLNYQVHTYSQKDKWSYCIIKKVPQLCEKDKTMYRKTITLCITLLCCQHCHSHTPREARHLVWNAELQDQLTSFWSMTPLVCSDWLRNEPIDSRDSGRQLCYCWYYITWLLFCLWIVVWINKRSTVRSIFCNV